MDYRFLEVNDAFVEQTGLSREVAVGATIRELVPTHEQHWFDIYGQVALTGEPVRFENRAEGLGRWYEIHAFRIGGEGSREVGAIFKDISKRHEAERALADARARLNATLEAAEVATYDWDVPNDRLYGDDRLALFYGVPRDEGGSPIAPYFEGVHPDDRASVQAAIAASLASGERYETQYRLTGADGKERWVFVRGDTTLGSEGRPLRLSGVVVEVTDRIVAERALAEARRRLDETLETADVATFDWDAANDRLFGNALFARFFGIPNDPKGAPIGPYFERLHPEDRAPTQAAIAASLATGERYETQYRVYDADGRERWVLARGDTRFGAEGRPSRLSGVILNITERVAAQRALDAERARLDQTLQTADVAVYDWDVANDRIIGNDRLDEFFGIPQAEGGNAIAPYFDAIADEDREATQAAIARAFETETRYETSYRVTGAGGRVRWVLVRGDAKQDVQGRPSRLSGVVVDVTDRVVAERALDAERARFDAVLQLSPTFVTILRGEELRFEYANPAYLRLVGGRPTVGLTLAEAQPEVVEGGALGQRFDALLRETMRSGVPRHFTRVPVRYQPTPDAPLDDRVLDFVCQPLADADGTVTGIFAQGMDVTEQARAERAIQEREELFRTVFEQAPDDAILVMDLDRTITAWNPAAERVTGWSAEEAIGQRADLIFTPEDQARGGPEEETGGAARDGKAADERWHMRRDGSRFWGSGTMNALHDERGEVRGYLKVFRDATERYEETRTLAFLRRLTESLIDLRDPDEVVRIALRMLGERFGSVRIAFGELSDDGEIATVRHEWGPPGGRSLAGSYRVADFPRATMDDLRAGRIHATRDTEREYALGKGLEAVRALGSRASAVTPILKEGRLSAYVAVFSADPRDWTASELGLLRQVADRTFAVVERARAEAALRAGEERFRGLADNMDQLAWMADPEGSIFWYNRRWFEYTGTTLDQMQGWGWQAVHDPEILPLVVERIRASFATGEPFDMEFPLRGADGEFRPFLTRMNPIRDAEGRVTLWFGTNTDVTEIRAIGERLERMVAERTAELQKAVSEAEGFNYSISHDLRTPLRAMVATSSILMEEAGPELSESHRELLERQVHNASRMGRLIDELLRLSRLARAEVKREIVDVTAKARSVFRELEEQGRTNGCRLDTQDRMTAEADRNLLRTVFQNLLGNACKFSPQGGTIRVRQEGKVFSVSDEGVGFDMAHAARMFLPFERLVSDAEFEGTGIGLANVKRIVERHGGRVWAESEPGHGATFSFTLG